MLDQSGHDIAGIRENLQLSYSAHLTAGLGGDHILHSLDQFGCREQRVMSLSHGRGPCMIGKAANLYLELVDADDTFHHADGDVFLLEGGSLFNMEFQVAAEGPGSQ